VVLQAAKALELFDKKVSGPPACMTIPHLRESTRAPPVAASSAAVPATLVCHTARSQITMEPKVLKEVNNLAGIGKGSMEMVSGSDMDQTGCNQTVPCAFQGVLDRLLGSPLH
jgi:hypothetical protein